MTQKLTQVVIWKPRATPGNRVFPPHLKLAILSRGRIALPTPRLNWLVDVARAEGATWPDDLSKPLEQIVPQLDVTIELFRKQRRSLSTAEISQSIAAYLELRRLAHLPGCLFLLFAWAPHVDRRVLERNLDLDISLLFARPRVFSQPRADDPYVLLTYACIPMRVRPFLNVHDTLPAPPPLLNDPKPPLDATTATNAEYTVRTGPSTNAVPLGEQDGHSVPVFVLDKRQTEGHTWFQIQFRQDMRVKHGPKQEVARRTTAWIVKEGLDFVAAPWDLFRHELISLESAMAQDTRSTRITRLRQRTHKRTLPFDSVIDTPPGDTYLEDIPDDPDTWQMAKDYNAVIAPDGRPVDVNHVLVGLDVLRRIETPAYYINLHVGSNWAAATWSGDVGSAVADMQLRMDRYWENRNPTASSEQRAEHYFSTRTSEWDLLGDLDPWELTQPSQLRGTTVDDILASYYEQTIPGVTRELTRNRAYAIGRFLLHYGFTYDSDTDLANYPALRKQRGAMSNVIREVRQFAAIWIAYRLFTTGEDSNFVMKKINTLAAVYKGASEAARPDNEIVNLMATLFVYWLEYAAIEHNVSATL